MIYTLASRQCQIFSRKILYFFLYTVCSLYKLSDVTQSQNVLLCNFFSLISIRLSFDVCVQLTFYTKTSIKRKILKNALLYLNPSRTALISHWKSLNFYLYLWSRVLSYFFPLFHEVWSNHFLLTTPQLNMNEQSITLLYKCWARFSSFDNPMTKQDWTICNITPQNLSVVQLKFQCVWPLHNLTGLNNVQ